MRHDLPALSPPRYTALHTSSKLAQGDMNMATLSIGGSQKEKVTVHVTKYERAQSSEHHDDTWLNVVVLVSAGALSGEFSATFVTEEFVTFRSQVQTLYQTLKGTATSTTIERQLALTSVGDGRGHVHVKGEARDQPGVGHSLSFELIDQTQLASALRAFDQITEAFPVRASNSSSSGRDISASGADKRRST